MPCPMRRSSSAPSSARSTTTTSKDDLGDGIGGTMTTKLSDPETSGSPSGAGRSMDDRLRAGAHPLSRVADTTLGLLTKLVLIAAFNAVGIFMLVRMASADAPLYALALTLVTTLALNYVYLGKHQLPLKYLIPGTLFLLVFQAWPFVYTFFIAFTNYSTGQILTQDQAIERIETLSITTLPDAPRFDAIPFADGDDFGLLLTGEDEQVFFGTADDGLTDVDDLAVEVDGDRIVEVEGYERLSLGAAQDSLEELTELRIPIEQGEIQLVSLSSATLREQTRFYDPETETLTDVATDAVYVMSDQGRFVSEDGTDTLTPGWRVVVGWENFVSVLTDEAIRGPFGRVLIWTYVFAFASTFATFAVGLGLAITLNDARVKGRKFYRLALIIPYALPTFMTALIWRGLMNRSFGVINDMLGVAVPWLNDPTWAKFSVVLVNLWFGFPYMFLICTAALQSIPEDVYEASSIDGAGGWQQFRGITLPLLLIAIAPVLVATFAFNFNNFNVIYLLTGGNPPIAGAATPAGHTDILISYTYRIAFESGGGQDFGLGATVAILTFILVAAMAVYSFRWVRPLEEINE
jgi:arabinogalactan oligomer / maltooligosaccharide transport system permease protein